MPARDPKQKFSRQSLFKRMCLMSLMKLHFAVMLHFVADRSAGGLLATVHIIRVF